MRVGLALSGGGARGIAHLGVLKALEELGIEIHEISGTSAGAMAAAFYTHGYSPEETLEILTKTKLSKAIWPSFGLKGLLSTSKGEAIFAKYLDHKNFEKASIPLKIAVTNLNTGQGEVFSSGPLVKSIMASSCIPIMFEPVAIKGQLYVDGGIANNLPAECLRDSCDVVIGVNAVPIIPQHDLKGVKKLIERVSMIALSANVNTSAALCDLVIKPNDLRKYDTLNLRHASEIFELGYDYTHHVFEVNKDKTIIQRLLGKVEEPVSLSQETS